MRAGFLQDLGLLWLRFFMGLGIANHGYQKIFGGMIPRFTQGVEQMGFPMPEAFAWAAALSEFLGGLFIAAGLATRPAALFVFGTMSVAAFIAHASDPLQVKELAVAYWTIAGFFILAGAGGFSLDALLKRKKG